jgi:shikimate kinase
MRIYLVGYMGSGKSTLGRRLACHAQLHFIDLDKYIEERNCRTVPQIFALEGEESFRKKERKALEEVSEFDNVVVATGGGAPCFYDNMELMNRTGITIFLDIHPEILAKRLIASKTERPLIKGKSNIELEQFIGTNLQKRRLFYEQSAIRIGDQDMNPDLLIQLITESGL